MKDGESQKPRSLVKRSHWCSPQLSKNTKLQNLHKNECLGGYKFKTFIVKK